MDTSPLKTHSLSFENRAAPLLLSLALAILNSVSGTTYHVAADNSRATDEWPGTLEQPLKSISKAVEKAQPGDTILIHSGTYRERVFIKTSGSPEKPLRFDAAPGEHVVLTGADRLTGWRKEDAKRPIYSVAWPHKFITWNASMTHPNDEYHRTIGHCEQVVINGFLLREILNSDQLAPGTFFVDTTNKTLLVWDAAGRDLNKLDLQASVRPEIFRVEGNYVELRGFHFRYAANMAQHGAVILAGRFNTMEDCVLESMNSSGASFQGEDALVRRCVFRDNGQLGFGASRAHRLRFTECLVENNNTKDFDRGWEAGGDKLALCHDVILERSRFLRNRGNGIWFDIGNTNCTVRQCFIAENEDAGIFYEISFALRAHDNVIVRNGFALNKAAWGAQAGISLSSSPYCVIERNLIVGNREGFNFREQLRTTPTIDDRSSHAVWNHDQLIRNNFIVFNRDAQVWGWFDVKDNRHWPVAAKNSDQPSPSAAAKNIAAPYLAQSTQSQPRDLTLMKLLLNFEGNVYFALPGQSWFNWGPTWARHQSYSGLAEFQSALGIDRKSRTLAPPFADLLQLDFRLDAETMASLGEAYPEGSVPGVSLGVK